MEKTFYLNIIFANLFLFVFVILFDDGKVNDTPLKERFFDFLNKMRELYFPKVQRFYYSAKHNEWLAKLNEGGGMLDFNGHYEYDYLTGRHEYVYGEPTYRKNRRVFMGGFEYTEWVSSDAIEPLTNHFGDLVLICTMCHEDQTKGDFKMGPEHQHGVFFNENFDEHRMPQMKDIMDPGFQKVLITIFTSIGSFLERMKNLKVATN